MEAERWDAFIHWLSNHVRPHPVSRPPRMSTQSAFAVFIVQLLRRYPVCMRGDKIFATVAVHIAGCCNGHQGACRAQGLLPASQDQSSQSEGEPSFLVIAHDHRACLPRQLVAAMQMPYVRCSCSGLRFQLL